MRMNADRLLSPRARSMAASTAGVTRTLITSEARFAAGIGGRPQPGLVFFAAILELYHNFQEKANLFGIFLDTPLLVWYSIGR